MMDPEPKVYFANRTNREVTVEDNDIVLAKQAAYWFLQARDGRNDAERMLLDAPANPSEVREGLARNLHRARQRFEACQENLMPFLKDGTLAKAGFGHLETETIDFREGEAPSPLVSRVTYDRDLSEARRLAEKLRNELWKHVRREGDPEEPTKKLPWE